MSGQGTPRLVIASDGSASAATALRAAASLFPSAIAYVATVPPDTRVRVGTALPVLPSTSPSAVQDALDGLDAEARRQAADTAQEAVDRAQAHGLQAEAVSVPPSAAVWAALLDVARQQRADVLACGTRGRGAFARALLGSTSSRLLHHTDVPLLVVPDGAGTLYGPAILAYDGSEGARHAIQVAGRLFAGRAAVVVHAWIPAFRSMSARGLARAGGEVREIVELLHEADVERAAATMQEGVDAARAAGLDAEGESIEADEGAWRAVAAAARAHGASVIVAGTRGLGAARSALVGSVSSGLVQNAEVPVLVVPSEAAASGDDRTS